MRKMMEQNQECNALKHEEKLWNMIDPQTEEKSEPAMHASIEKA